MADIKKMNEIIQPELKRLFNNFFEDKYSREAQESIFEDLYKMFYENLIDEINFCLFDSVEQKIIGGYSLKISLNQTSNLVPPKSYELEKLKISSTTEKFLIIKLNEKGINSTERNESELNELNDNWDFLKKPEIKMKTEKQQLLWVEDTRIELQEIIND